MASEIARVAVDTAIYVVDKPYDYLIPQGLDVQVGQRVLVPFGRGNRRIEAIVLAITLQSEYDSLKSVVQVLDAAPVVDEHALRLAVWMNDRFYCTMYEALRAMLPIGLWYQVTETIRLTQPFVPDIAYPLVAHDATLTRGLEILAEAKGTLPLTEWQAAAGAKWQGTLQALMDLALVSKDAQTKRRKTDKMTRMVRLSQPSEEVLAHMAKMPRSAKVQRELFSLLMSIDTVSVADLLQFTGASTSSLQRIIKDGFAEIVLEEPIQEQPEVVATPPELTLNPSQETAFMGLQTLLSSHSPSCALLYGVTGSGKTSVYIKLLQEVVAEGGQAIVMVPEIALTPQLIAVFQGYFGGAVAVLHSALGVGERLEAWRAIRAGNRHVIVGTRSAVFAPLPNLRLIIMDEEQENTYKSENAPRYHARDVAKFRCVQANALLLLGSATPSIDTAYFAQKGVYHKFTLTQRYNQGPLPAVVMADMKEELRNGNATTISQLLADELQQNFDKGEQSILFLNRRGYHRMVTCSDCGHVQQCPNCSVSLTFHGTNQRLMCHYCGYSVRKQEECPVCHGRLVFLGAGTQKIVEDLQARFGDIEVLRMDTDTMGYRGAHQAMLTQFTNRNVPILVGTQMVAKGLNLDNVTLVGVISADMSLFVDDFRANERTFNLITQVVGRAGRGKRLGRAVIQSFSPSHPVLLQAAKQDFDAFFAEEVCLREAQGYPPFSDMILLNAFSDNQENLLQAMLTLRKTIEKTVREGRLALRVVGPAPASVLKINNRYRYHITLYGHTDSVIRRMVSSLLRQFSKDKHNRGVTLYADLHPYQF